MALREIFAKFDIKVDGAEKIKAADTATTKAKKSSEQLGTTIKDTGAKFRDAGKAIKAFAEGAVHVGHAAVTAADVFLSLRNRASMLGRVLRTLAVAFVGLGIVFTTKAMWGFVSSVTGAVDEMGKMSTALGISTEAMQRWEHVTKTAGGSQEDLRSSFKTLARQIQQAKEGNETALKSFRDLGVEFEDGNKKLRPLEEVMIDTTSKIAAMSDQSTKLAVTQTLLSETALKLLPGFKASREEMEAHLKSMDALAGVHSEEFIRAAEATNDELHFMGNQFKVLKAGIVMAFLPSFRAAVEWVSKSTAAFREFLKETDAVSRWLKIGAFAGFLRFSTLLVTHWSKITGLFARLTRMFPRFLPFLRQLAMMVARFVAWALVLDDIIVFLQGGESKIGDFLDAAFGIGTADKISQGFRDTLEAISTVFGWLWDDVKEFAEALKKGEKPWQDWGGVVGGAIREAIDAAAKLFGWLDKILNISGKVKNIISFVGDQIFEADETRLNAEARARAAGVAVAGAPGAPPRAAGSQTSNVVTDNSQVNVTLNGKQSPETVREATGEAKKLRSNRAAANALVRGPA